MTSHPVEQVDRDALSDILAWVAERHLSETARQDIRDGRRDGLAALEILARHRINASRPVGEGVELLRRAMNLIGVIADNKQPDELVADNGMTVWDALRADSVKLWERYRALSHQPAPPVEVADLCAQSFVSWLRDREISFPQAAREEAADLIERLSVSSMGRAEAFEEAAKVADGQGAAKPGPDEPESIDEWWRGYIAASEDCAKAIRALSEPPVEGEGGRS